jgi:hypothetical protein
MVLSVRVSRFMGTRGRSVFRWRIASLRGGVDVLLRRIVCWIVWAVRGIVGVHGRRWGRGEIVGFGEVAAFSGVCLGRTVATGGIGRVFMSVSVACRA